MNFTYSGSEPQPSLAWTFESSNVDSVTSLQPSAQVSPGPAQLQGSAALVTNAPTSNTALYCTGSYATNTNFMNLGTSTSAKFDYNSSNLFCEFWWYTSNTVGGNLNTPISLSDPSSTAASFRTQVRRNSGFQLNFSTSVANTTPLSSGTWYHFAFSVDSTNKVIYPFVNGFGGVSASYTGTLSYNSAYSIQVGYSSAIASNYYYDQYIRDLRVVQGGAVPVATFTPGAAPFSYASPGYVANMGTTVFTLLGQFVTYPSGKYGSSIIFRNPSTPTQTNYISYNNKFQYQVDNGFSVSSWVKIISLPSINESYAFEFNTSDGAAYISIYCGVQPSGNFFLQYYDGIDFKGLTLVNPVVLNKWYNVVCSVGSGRVDFYLDNVNKRSITYTPRGRSIITGYLGRGCDCELDDLRIYNTALTSTQVQSVYSSQGAPAPSRAMPLPKYAWDFNGTTTPYIGAATGTTTGTVSYNSSGKYGQSLIMNGSSYITYNYPAPITLSTTGATISMWLKTLTLPPSTVSHWLFASYGSAMNSRIYAFYYSDGSVWFYFIDNLGGYIGTSTYLNNPTLGAWSHYAFVLGADNVALYKNGVLMNSYAAKMSGITLDTRFTIAALSGGGGGNINAEYDDLRIFDRALTSAQVQAVFNQQGTPGLTKITGPTSFTLPTVPGYTYIPFRALPPSFTLTQTVTSNAWTYGSGQITDGGANPNLTLVADVPGDLYSAVNPRVWYRLGRQGGTNEYVRHGGFVMFLQSYTANNFDFAWAFFLKDGTTNQVKIWNPYPANGTGYWVQSGIYTAGRVAISTTDPNAAHVYAMSTASTPYSLVPSALSGTPLFRQIPSSAVSSAVGAFSLRAVNGLTAKAVQVRPQGQFPATGFTSAVTSPGGNQYNQTLTGYAFGGAGAYTSNCSSWASLDGGNLPTPWKAFDYNTLTWWENNFFVETGYNGIGATSANTYSGSYTTSVSGSSVGGEWLQLGFPTAIVLYSYSMYNRFGYNGFRMPYAWTVAGSNDGTTWATVDSQTGIIWTSATQTFTTTSTTTYLYFRLIVRAIQSNGNTGQPVNIGQWTLNGSNASWNTDFYADRLGKLWTTPYTGQDLGAWLGGAIGYVTTWYDQSGRGNDASQATAANQPIIQKATKGPGYSTLWPGLTSTRLIYGTSSNIFDSTNYSVCVAAKRTAAVSTTTYYAGTNGQPVTNQNLGVGYSNDTTLRLSEYGYSLNAPTVSAYTGVSEPLGYDFFTFSQTSGMRNYTWRSGTSASNTNTGLTTPLTRSGNSTIGGTNDSASFTGEIYELLVFTKSLYDLDTSGGLINKIYNNQSGYTGI